MPHGWMCQRPALWWTGEEHKLSVPCKTKPEGHIQVLALCKQAHEPPSFSRDAYQLNHHRDPRSWHWQALCETSPFLALSVAASTRPCSADSWARGQESLRSRTCTSLNYTVLRCSLQTFLAFWDRKIKAQNISLPLHSPWLGLNYT